MNEPILSVIVPVYKTEKYIDACLRSILDQNLKDIEVILVDDASPDGCPAICDDYARGDDRVKVVHKPNQGLGYARNSGFDVARGRYVTFIDSDDEIHPEAYEKAVGLMESTGADQVRFGCMRFTDSGLESATHYDAEPKTFEGKEQMRRLALCIFGTVDASDQEYDLGGSSCMAIYKRDIILRNGIRFESEREFISEDYLFSFYYYLASSKVIWLDRTYYRYRVNPSSLTHKLNPRFMSMVETFCRHVEEAIAGSGYPDSCRRYVHAYYLTRQRVAMKYEFNCPGTLADKKKWFKAQSSNEYFRKECESFPADNLPWKRRMVLKATLADNFTLCYGMVKLMSVFKPDTLK